MVHDLAAVAHPVRGGVDDYDGIVAQARDRTVVLVGEASHGTHDFYRERSRITRRLIEEADYLAVAVEGDWPDVHRLHRYVTGRGSDANARDALHGFTRFPTWMWRNTEVAEFAEWLRVHNDGRAPADRVGWYGLDLYSLRASMEAVVDYLERIDPQEAARARLRYACFDHVGGEGYEYAQALARRRVSPCEDEVVAQLVDLRARAEAYLRRDGLVAEDDFFSAEQNAVVVRDAEEYYQQMYRGDVSSWNLRDRHMAATLDALLAHLGRRHRHPRVVVWAHNSHVGDARATEMSARGELTIGQLARQRYGHDALLVGFTTYDGSVTAARDWGDEAEQRWVRPALDGSHESFLHEVLTGTAGPARAWLDCRDPTVQRHLAVSRLYRAIGVVYRPETERGSHYFSARLADAFDAIIHLDRTAALEPLVRTEQWDDAEPPETYPSGL